MRIHIKWILFFIVNCIILFLGSLCASLGHFEGFIAALIGMVIMLWGIAFWLSK